MKIEECDEGFIATDPEYPGCWGYGLSPASAEEDFERAKADWQALDE